MAWRTYAPRQTLQARKVTKAETVGTISGPVTAMPGSYVVRQQTSKNAPYELTVMDADEFEKEFKANTADKQKKQLAVATVGAYQDDSKGVNTKTGNPVSAEKEKGK